MTVALRAAVPVLCCPVCRGALRLEPGRVLCADGHSFDLARQGYVNLSTGRPGPGTGDSTDMVAARHRWLAAGHYLPIAAALAGLVHEFRPHHPGPVAECGGGTGYYLAQVLDELDGAAGICLDLSVPALRRAARAHPRLAAVGADAWQRLPFRDATLSALLSVFAPRNLPEVERSLVPGGLFAVVTPQPEHLHDVAQHLGLIGIAPQKQERLAAQLQGFELLGERAVTYQLHLLRDQLADLVLMGPSARHLDPAELAQRLDHLPEPVPVTVAVTAAAYRLIRPAQAEQVPNTSIT
jgi:23S rRNA (guanine745-N1)-methyltransferase